MIFIFRQHKLRKTAKVYPFQVSEITACDILLSISIHGSLAQTRDGSPS